MKTIRLLLTTLGLCISLTAVSPALAQGTAFTYQGLLTTTNGPVNGTYDLTFALWDSFAGGSQVGNSITNPPWHVTSGEFTTPLDFGANFSGAPLWLEIGVRSNGVGAFNILSPRQALTPTPYAIYAESATGLANGVAIGDGVGNMIVPGTQDSFIGGGNGNNILDGSMNSAIAGGMGNIVQSRSAWSFIGGGQDNQTFSAFSSIGGGGGNVVTANANYSTVGGGYHNTASGLFATVGGGDANTASGIEATVAGGSFNSANGADATVGGGTNNVASALGATIAGGRNNIANNTDATVGGGRYNNANNTDATVGGGAVNTASGQEATVAGGANNVASGTAATVSGGSGNGASGTAATVGGGSFNTAAGFASFAAGTGATAAHDNSFVWADNESAYSSDRPQQFKIQAGGGIQMDVSGSHGVRPAALFINSTSADGVGLYVLQTNSTDACLVLNSFAGVDDACAGGDLIKGFGWTKTMGCFGLPNQLVFEVTVNGDVRGHSFNSISDRNAKENFTPVCPAQVLEKVNSLPVSQWTFKGGQPDVQHIGPMAQDFHAAFGLNGADETHISLTDEGGVALAAIQGLNQKLEDRLNAKDAEIQNLKARLQLLEKCMSAQKGDEQ